MTHEREINQIRRKVKRMSNLKRHNDREIYWAKEMIKKDEEISYLKAAFATQEKENNMLKDSMCILCKRRVIDER